MDDTVLKALAAKYGLPDSASEDDVNAAAVAAAIEALKPPETTDDADATAQAEKDAADAAALATAEADQAAAAEAEAAKGAGEGTETDPILAEQAKQLAAATARIATMEAREAAREKAATASRRDGKTDKLVAEGRITPAEHGHYRHLYDIDEPGVDKLCASLAPGRVPVPKPTTTAAALGTDDDEALYQASCARMGHAPTTAKVA